ncbi:prepilin-type N-terminal cleavage/methylation domain-containing protein [Blautia schinkii]|nr:prepilin-type N-terminal cleavage/methylation domain-containing protein [Blautia schinkii]
MLKWFNKKKKDNKGFTLVELVVVVAILAILVGLLAPQYTKYVERSRKSSDCSNLENMVRAIEIAAADPSGKIKAATYKITINEVAPDDGKGVGVVVSGVTDTDGALKAEAELAITSTVGSDSLDTTLKSKNWDGDEIHATIVVGDDYSFDVTYDKEVTEYIGKTAEKTDPPAGGGGSNT